MSKLLTCFFLLLALHGRTQKNEWAAIPETRIPHYEMEAAGCDVLYVPLGYGIDKVSKEQRNRLSLLKDKLVAAVDVVYTDYPASTNFSSLTSRRISTLLEILPDLKNQPDLVIRKIRQTAAVTRQDAADYLHGFFIYYRDKPDASGTGKDVTTFRSLIGLPVDTAMLDPDPFFCTLIFYVEDTSVGQGIFPAFPNTKRTITRMPEGQALLRVYPDSVFDVAAIRKKVFLVVDSSLVNCATDAYTNFWMEDSTVTKVFNRNKWPQPVVVADVTGSMSPYAAQLMKWMKLKLTDKSPETKGQYYFFNDGDAKADAEKKTGEVGGIYKATSINFDGVTSTILQAMGRGGGGDAQENNIEALLKAQETMAAGDSLILIADNWAPVRDMKLLSKLKHPVKVIVCGVVGTIHRDYLRIARETGGSVHLLEDDIYHLAEVKEGGVITINKRTYKLIDSVFVDLGTLSL